MILLVSATARSTFPGRVPLDRFMGSSPVRFIASIFYGIYLFHTLVIALIFPVVRLAYPHSPPPAAGAALFTAVVVVVMCAVSALVSYWVEEPLRLMGRRIAKRFESKGSF